MAKVTVHPYEVELEAKRAYQETDEFQEIYRERSAIERIGAHLKRHGMRAARYFGKTNTLFQVQMAGVLQNIKTIIRLTKGPRGELSPE